MTLHEAIKIVIGETGRPLTAREIADEINERKLYIRSDKHPVPSSQIHARVKNYPHLFRKENGKIKLVDQVTETYLQYSQDERNIFQEEKRIVNDNRNLTKYSQSDSFSRKALQNLSLSEWFDELVTTMYALSGSKENNEIKVASLIFAYRLLQSESTEAIISKKGSLQESKDSLADLDKVISLIRVMNQSKSLDGIFNPFLESINQTVTFSNTLIGKAFSLYDLSESRYSSEEFGTAFYAFIKKYLIDKNNKGFEYWSTEPLAEIIVATFANELKDGDSIYDPAVGYGGFLLEIEKYAKNKNVRLRYSGQEINPEIAAFCRMNLIANGILDAEIISGNSITHPALQEESVNYALTDPPYGMNIRRLLSDNKSDTNYLRVKTSEATGAFLQLLFSRIKSSGKMAIVVPSVFLSNNRELHLRKSLIDSDVLESVIDIPEGIHHNTRIRTSILVLNKNKSISLRNRYQFFNTSGFEPVKPGREMSNSHRHIMDRFKELIGVELDEFRNLEVEEIVYAPNNLKMVLVDTESIETSDYNLNSEYYINPTIRKLDEIRGENLVSLEDIIRSVRSKPVTPGESRYSSLPYIGIRALERFPDEYDLKPAAADSTFEEAAKSGHHIDRSVLMIGPHGKSLLAKYFRFNTEPVTCSRSIMTFELDENRVLPEYLIHQLRSDIVNQQLKAYSNWPARGLSVSDLKRIRIPLLPMSEQLNWLSAQRKKEIEKNQLATFINELNLVEDKEDIKAEIEKFAGRYFPESDHIEFRTELEFDKMPFEMADIRASRFIKSSSSDKQYKNLLIINSSNEIKGVLSIAEEGDINMKTYSEINAYANFMLEIVDFVRHTAASSNLAKFAHISKNHFLGLQFDIDAILKSPNKELAEQLSKLTIDTEEVIEQEIKEENASRESFLAINRLRDISEKVSRIAQFYVKTSTIYQDIVNSTPEAINLIYFIQNDCDLYSSSTLKCEEDDIHIFAKRNSIKQALTDLIQNAHQYSPEKTSEIEIYDRDTFVELTISNAVSQETLMSEERYNELGHDSIKRIDGNGQSYGVYWAFQTIHDSLGEIELLPWDEYRKNMFFQVRMKLRKNI